MKHMNTIPKCDKHVVTDIPGHTPCAYQMQYMLKHTITRRPYTRAQQPPSLNKPCRWSDANNSAADVPCTRDDAMKHINLCYHEREARNVQETEYAGNRKESVCQSIVMRMIQATECN